MKILKYKKQANGRYKIQLDSGLDIELYEETILKFELLIRKSISEDLLMEISKYDKEWEIYYTGIKALRTRFRSVKELKELLLSKGYEALFVNKVVDKLIEQRYLDDRSFTKGYINSQMITSSRGPNRIMGDLVNKGVDSSIINEEILCFTEDLQIEKINKIINTSLKGNRTRGGVVLKNKITNDLVNAGYRMSTINKAISDYSFSNDSEIAKREYLKLYKKYSRKFSGKELEYKIKEKLYQKGLSYED